MVNMPSHQVFSEKPIFSTKKLPLWHYHYDNTYLTHVIVSCMPNKMEWPCFQAPKILYNTICGSKSKHVTPSIIHDIEIKISYWNITMVTLCWQHIYCKGYFVLYAKTNGTVMLPGPKHLLQYYKKVWEQK